MSRQKYGSAPADQMGSILKQENSTLDHSNRQSSLDSPKYRHFKGAEGIFKIVSALEETGSSSRDRGVQDFETLRNACKKEGKLFEDPAFPADDTSINIPDYKGEEIIWKRPKDIASEPEFFLEGVSRFDVKQGQLGNCWLIAAVANLTMDEKLFDQVTPKNQDFKSERYAGIFHFRFWQYGHWVDVVVDDRLPTVDDQLVFMHSNDKNEFWSALLEKAFAKLHGSYGALVGGKVSEALTDFTGGVSESYKIKDTPNLFDIVMKAHSRGSLLGCSISNQGEIKKVLFKEKGLTDGHAYSITRIVRFENKKLIRIRNPHGSDTEWKGAWSDESSEWDTISEERKKSLGLTSDNDGEFWMSFEDFCKWFTDVEITSAVTEIQVKNQHKWVKNIFEDAWVKGSTAGGYADMDKGRLYDSFCQNPQYIINLTEVDENDKECTVIVALMQKRKRTTRSAQNPGISITCLIYELKDDVDSLPRPLDTKFFRTHKKINDIALFTNARESIQRFKLPVGTYCIVPTTEEPNEEAEYLLRVISEKENNLKEHDEDVGLVAVDKRILNLVEPNESLIDECFSEIAGEDQEVDWEELQSVLSAAMKAETFNIGVVNKEICRSMIAMMDDDKSGKLGLEEFKRLWRSISTWTEAFKFHDLDNNGRLSNFELRFALNSAGYKLNYRVINAIMRRYGDKNGDILLDDFIMCSVKLTVMIDSFKEHLDEPKGKTASFKLKRFIETFVSI